MNNIINLREYVIDKANTIAEYEGYIPDHWFMIMYDVNMSQTGWHKTAKILTHPLTCTIEWREEK